MFKLLLYLVPLMVLSSCVLPRNHVYLKDSFFKSDSFQVNSGNDYLLKPGDNLSIGMKSLDAKSDFIFQRNPEGYTEAYHYLNSYTISDNGFINLPVIGTLHVADKSVTEITKIISDSLGQHFTEPAVYVKLSEFRITVLGEVRRPGTYPVYHGKVNILNALGYAGDITDRGNRRAVQIIRKSGGYEIIKTLDLTGKEGFSDNQFNLHPNDVIYVKPVTFKYVEENSGPFRLVLSAAAAILAIVRLTR